jgi:hypothetical protein
MTQHRTIGWLVHVNAVSAGGSSPVGERNSKPFQQHWVRMRVIWVREAAKLNQEARRVDNQREQPNALRFAPAELDADGQLEP